jgi:asparagine synthase (glutamine-hydrolysing)
VDVEVLKAALPFLAHPVKGDGYPKWALRQALDKPLPESVVRRKKQGFTFPWQEWMAGTALRQFDEKLKLPGAWQEILRPEALKKWRDAYVSGRAHWRCFWALFVLLTFLDRTDGK